MRRKEKEKGERDKKKKQKKVYPKDPKKGTTTSSEVKLLPLENTGTSSTGGTNNSTVKEQRG